METESNNIEPIIERDKTIIKFFKSKYVFYIFLIVLILFGAYIRAMPMMDHGGKPGLWDITTNSWTLGPDLDPFLFLRYAEAIQNTGSIPEVDSMRYAPLGYDTGGETKLLPYMIFYTFKLTNIFSDTYLPMEFAAAIFPVIMFILTILAFFFFIREAFLLNKDEEFNANLIASISTFFLIVVPSFLSRTIAGIPEKESAGFFFMFLSFYLFLKAWKTENNIWKSLFAVLAGLSTAAMGLIWGGVTYVYITIAATSLVAFILNKFKLKDYFVYLTWFFLSLGTLFMFTDRFSIKGFLLSIDTGIAFVVAGILLFHLIASKTNLYSTIRNMVKTDIPDNLLSIILAVIGMVIAGSIIIDPTFIFDKIADINRILFNPLAGGRWSTTVAENRQPYFVEWAGQFGLYFLWTFLVGSIIFIRDIFKKLETKDNNLVTGSYIILLFGLIFSRYAPHPSIFDGENIISKVFYLASALFFFGSLVYTYIKYNKKDKSILENINIGSLLMLLLFILSLFTARSAIRLVMVLATIAPIFAAYLFVKLFSNILKEPDTNKKIIIGIGIAIVGLSIIYSGIAYTNVTKTQAYNYVPYYYTLQWQQGMDWVRDNTPENAVFGHWWDYGYWLQSIGNRATITDGGNSIVYWNYLMGRYVLTGDNQKDSLEFLYTHDATHLLIDSSDIGKYGAFSQIGSDADLDRFSVGPIIMTSDQKMIQEKRYGISRAYQGGNYLDEDIYYNDTINIFKEQGAIIGVMTETSNNTYVQPMGIFYDRGRQINIPLRYLYINGKLMDFNSGIEGVAYPIQSVVNAPNGGLQVDQTGAMIYLSPRIFRGFLGQSYILDDPLNNFPAFEVEYKQTDYILQQLESQGVQLNDFVYYQGIRGPITIWGINYPADQKSNPEYLNKTFPEEITWDF